MLSLLLRNVTYFSLSSLRQVRLPYERLVPKLLDYLHNVFQFIVLVWVSLVFVDFSKLDVHVYTKASFQIGLHVNHLNFYSVVGVRLGFLL